MKKVQFLLIVWRWRSRSLFYASARSLIRQGIFISAAAAGYVWNSHKNKKIPTTVGVKSVPNPVGNCAQLLILMGVRFAVDNPNWMDPLSIGNYNFSFLKQ